MSATQSHLHSIHQMYDHTVCATDCPVGLLVRLKDVKVGMSTTSTSPQDSSADPVAATYVAYEMRYEAQLIENAWS